MSATLDQLFAQFLRERKYLRNVSPQTIEWYETAWHSFKKSATACPSCPGDLRQHHLEEFVYALRERGVRPVTVNTWLKALNTFFDWTGCMSAGSCRRGSPWSSCWIFAQPAIPPSRFASSTTHLTAQDIQACLAYAREVVASERMFTTKGGTAACGSSRTTMCRVRLRLH